MNARSLQSVLVLLAQILGPFGQTWVFHKFGWVFHKFTENGEFYIVWIHTIRHKNRDACISFKVTFKNRKLWWEKTQISLNCAITLMLRRPPHRVLLNCQNKLARLGALSQQCIKLHAQNVTFFCTAFF